MASRMILGPRCGRSARPLGGGRLARPLGGLLLVGSLVGSGAAVAAPGVRPAVEAAPVAGLSPELRAALAPAGGDGERGAVRAVWHAAGAPRLLTGLRAATEGAEPLARAAHFLGQHGAALNLPGGLTPVAFETAGHSLPGEAAFTRVRLVQRVDGVPVLDRSAVLTLDAEGRVRSLSSDAVPLRAVAPARIAAETAVVLAVEAVLGRMDFAVAAKASARPVVLAVGDEGVAGFEVRVLHAVVRVDAAAGAVLAVRTGYME